MKSGKINAGFGETGKEDRGKVGRKRGKTKEGKYQGVYRRPPDERSGERWGREEGRRRPLD